MNIDDTKLVTEGRLKAELNPIRESIDTLKIEMVMVKQEIKSFRMEVKDDINEVKRDVQSLKIEMKDLKEQVTNGYEMILDEIKEMKYEMSGSVL